MNRAARAIAALAPALAAAACATTTADVTATIQPRHPQAAQLRRVAVLPFGGNAGGAFAPRLQAALAGTAPHLTVVEASAAGLNGGSQQQALALGRRLGLQGVYFGDASTSVSRQTSNEKRTRCAQFENNNTLLRKCLRQEEYTVSCTTTTASATAVPKLVSVATGAVVYSRTVGRSSSSKQCADRGPGLDDGQLLGAVMSGVVVDIARDVAPWTTAVSVQLKPDAPGMAAADREVFKSAALFAKSGRLDRACGAYQSLETRNAENVALLYNLGVCEETGGDFGEALARYAAADALLTRPDKDINTALVRARKLLAGVDPGAE